MAASPEPQLLARMHGCVLLVLLELLAAEHGALPVPEKLRSADFPRSPVKEMVNSKRQMKEMWSA